MDEVLDKLAKQAGTFSNTIDAARKRTRAVNRRLRGVEALEQGDANAMLDLEEADERT